MRNGNEESRYVKTEESKIVVMLWIVANHDVVIVKDLGTCEEEREDRSRGGDGIIHL